MTATCRIPKNTTILVADDEAAVRDALAGLLEIEGYRVLCCEDGVSALATVARHRPDFVVTDFMMPRMSGLELAIEMKSSRALCNIPIIVVSGAHASLAHHQSALFTAILEKPYRVESLLRLFEAPPLSAETDAEVSAGVPTQHTARSSS
jgi:CheY-like chemotaxis protein